MSALLGVPEDAAYHLVCALTCALVPLLGGFAAVAAVIICTVAVRLLVTPLTFRALRGQAAQARLAPEIQRLRDRYGRQPERFQRELTALYRREGTHLLAGLGPLIAQWPVFSLLYLLFRSPSVAGGPNRLLSGDLLGVPLGGHWLAGAPLFGVHGAVFAGTLAVLALACWLLARAARKMTAPVPRAVPQARPQPGALIRVLPYVTVLIAVFAPLAVVLYLVTSTSWSAVERLVFTARQQSGAVPGKAAAG